jgi:hypothetical protein
VPYGLRHRGQSVGDERELSSSHRTRDTPRTSIGTFPVDPMTGRDRTAEFLSVVKLLQTRQVSIESRVQASWT